MSVEPSLLVIVATTLMVLAGTSKTRLEWRPRPVRLRRRRAR
jgi:hypothetical protein